MVGRKAAATAAELAPPTATVLAGTDPPVYAAKTPATLRSRYSNTTVVVAVCVVDTLLELELVTIVSVGVRVRVGRGAKECVGDSVSDADADRARDEVWLAGEGEMLSVGVAVQASAPPSACMPKGHCLQASLLPAPLSGLKVFCGHR